MLNASEAGPKPIGFAPPPVDEDTVAAVTRVLRSGWITSGPELAAFESELSAYVGVSSVLCFSSWTTACELALRWYGIGPGDEVILPVMTYAATANIVLHCGATPVFVDVELGDRVVSLNSLQSAWSPRTKAVMPVDLGGWPVAYAEISTWLNSDAVRSGFSPSNEVQRQFGRPLFLADAAHSFGATYDGAPVGQQADITGFSFHAVKNLTTAEGGALAFKLPPSIDSKRTQAWFKSMALHGQSRSAHEKTTSGNWQYDVQEAGFKCNMTDIQAAIGRVQLTKYPSQLLRRKAIVARYHAGLASKPWYGQPAFADAKRESSFHLFALRILGIKAEQRDHIMQDLRASHIATNVHFIPLPMLTLHKQRGERMDSYPNAQRLFDESLSLPVHLELSDSDVDRIIQCLCESVDRRLDTAAHETIG